MQIHFRTQKPTTASDCIGRTGLVHFLCKFPRIICDRVHLPFFHGARHWWNWTFILHTFVVFASRSRKREFCKTFSLNWLVMPSLFELNGSNKREILLVFNRRCWLYCGKRVNRWHVIKGQLKSREKIFGFVTGEFFKWCNKMDAATIWPIELGKFSLIKIVHVFASALSDL